MNKETKTKIDPVILFLGGMAVGWGLVGPMKNQEFEVLIGTEVYSVHEEKEQCEQDLPRNQQCSVEILIKKPE